MVLLQSKNSAGNRAAEHPPRRVDQGLSAALPEKKSKQRLARNSRETRKEMKWSNHTVDVFHFLISLGANIRELMNSNSVWYDYSELFGIIDWGSRKTGMKTYLSIFI